MLHWAVDRSQIDVIQLLLDHGANFNAQVGFTFSSIVRFGIFMIN